MKEVLKRIIPKKIYYFVCKLYDELIYVKNSIIYNFNEEMHNKFVILDEEDTVNLIVNEHKSLSRFGDGEFKWILNIHQKTFQDYDEKMAVRLKEVLTTTNTNLLIGIPKVFNDMNGNNHKAKSYWINFLCKHYKKVFPLLDKTKEYSNASITRPYIDLKDKNEAINKFELLKKIWDGRDVLIVEGENTKMGIGNDLLENAKSITRELCPSTNAFNQYDEILERVKKYDKKYLVLICLGPTATILAYDLSKLGFQAIDSGHIDVEYEWFLQKARKKQKIVGKEVNEATDK